MGQSAALEPANLLWSGGWDSTFRLLQLVLIEKRPVQPYYVIDPQRQSLRQELVARRNIQTRLFQEYPHTKELILPTFFYEVGDIAPDEEITSAYNTYRKIKAVDYQYSWLARFCKQMNIRNMELCIEARGPYPEQTYAMRVFTSFLEPNDAHSHEAHIAPEFKGTVVETIFKYFRFPIRGLTRQAMDNIATHEGWRHYLFMTWFCQHPVNTVYPCGVCGPCQLTIRKGYGQRIPWRRRVFASLGLEKWRNWAAQTLRQVNPAFHQWQK